MSNETKELITDVISGLIVFIPLISLITYAVALLMDILHG